jgi:hypothetical protein
LRLLLHRALRSRRCRTLLSVGAPLLSSCTAALHCRIEPYSIKSIVGQLVALAIEEGLGVHFHVGRRENRGK